MTMHKLLLAAFLLAWPSLAWADRDASVQFAAMLQAIVDASPPSAGYTGPFDIITSSKYAGYSTRLLSSSYTGKALFLCTGSNTTGCADIGFDSSTHSLKASDITAQGCVLGSTCRVVIWYDQSGNGSGGGGTATGNDLQARSLAAEPVLTSNCPSSGLYCIAFTRNIGDGGGSSMGNGSGWSPATVTNFTAFIVFSPTSGSFTNTDRIAGASSASGETLRSDFFTGAGTTGCTSSDTCLRWICLSGVCPSNQVIGVPTTTAIHQYVWWQRNSSTNTVGIALDQGTATTVNSSESAAASFVGFCIGGPPNTGAGCAGGSAGFGFGGNIEEWVMFSADDSGSITGGVSANQKSFWGTP